VSSTRLFAQSQIKSNGSTKADSHLDVDYLHPISCTSDTDMDVEPRLIRFWLTESLWYVIIDPHQTESIL